MVGKAHFFQKPNTLSELAKATSKAEEQNARKAAFCVRAEIILTEEDFSNFIESFKRTYEFITPHRVFLYTNNLYQYICLAVTSLNSDFYILVNTSGYSFARNVALFKKVHWKEKSDARL